MLSPGGKPISYVPTWVEWSITAGAFAGFECLVKINNTEDVWPALKKLFSNHPEMHEMS